MPTVLQFSTPSLGADTDKALVDLRQSGGPPAPGPLYNQLSAPQLSEGQTGIRPPVGGQVGGTYTGSQVDPNTGVYTYEELWGVKVSVPSGMTVAQLLASPTFDPLGGQKILEFVSGEPVDWAEAQAELTLLGVNVYAPMRFEYYPAPTLTPVPPEVEALTRIKEFDVRVSQGSTTVTAGRMLRTRQAVTQITVDHWLLGPSFQPPSTFASLRLVPKSVTAASVGAFLSAFPVPNNDWLYVQAVYLPSPTSPIVTIP